MIPTRRIFEICIVIVIAIVAAMAFHAWLASHDDQLRLQATLAAQKQQLDAANDRERDRAATLNQTLAEIEKLKRETQTPQQVLRDLPQYLKLPQPITLDSAANARQADEQLRKQNGKGTGAAGHSAGAERSAIAPEISPASTPSHSILSGIKKALQKKTTPNPAAANDESLPDEANRSASASSAVIQATPNSSTKSGAEISLGDLKPLGPTPAGISSAIRRKLQGSATRQSASGGNLPDPGNQRASASPSQSQSVITPHATPNTNRTSTSTASATSAGTSSEVVPDVAGRRSASASPSQSQSALTPHATQTSTSTSAATTATAVRLSAEDKSASAASGNVAADAKTSATSTPVQAAQAASAPPSAEIPAADLKPLYDYVQDCRACQAQLIAAKQNRADDAAKLQALTRERDAAITTAKGGTFWRRLRRNAEWFVIGGATATAAAVVAAHRIAPTTPRNSKR